MIDYIYPLCVAENYVDLVIRIAMLLSGLTDAALVITDVDTIWLCILRITDRGAVRLIHPVSSVAYYLQRTNLSQRHLC